MAILSVLKTTPRTSSLMRRLKRSARFMGVLAASLTMATAARQAEAQYATQASTRPGSETFGGAIGQRLAIPSRVSQAMATSRQLSGLAAGTQLHFAIGLPLRNQAQLDLLLAQIADATSPNFQHYLTPQQFTEQFGPSEQDYEALIRFAESSGLTVTGTHANRMLLDVAGAVPTIENTLHVKMMTYRHPVRGEFFAADREPTPGTPVNVLDISGLDNFELPRPMSLKTVPLNTATPYVTGTGPGGYFIGKDFRAAYAPNVTLTGSGQTVGLLEFDGFYAADVQRNFAAAGLPPVPTQTVLLDGFNGAAGSANIEVTLDIMMAAYMAPGVAKVIVYEGSNPNDILNRMATDNLAQQISSSWGFSGVNATTEQIFKQFIAQGQSFLQASGDSGAYTNGVMTPSDDPSLTVVGGTSLTTNGAGGPWQAEGAWSGSGGGTSTAYPIPSWQQNVSMAASHGSTRMRNIPDVALTADIQMYLIQNNGQAVVVGGTSAAAPLWAGFIALANQHAAANAKPRVGFLNPLLYAIGSSANYGTDFNDITHGNNTGFSAVAGYDLTTGWGSPAGQHLIYDLTGTSGAASFTLASSASALTVRQASTGSTTLTVQAKNSFTGKVNLGVTGLPAGVTAMFSPVATASSSVVTFAASASAAPGTYPVAITGVSGSLSSTANITLTVVAPSFSLSASATTVTVVQPGSASTTIAVTGQNGFSGSVSLSQTGVPTGVTTVFSPATTTSSSSLTFTASSSVIPGTYTVTVTGISGTLKASTAITLTVVAPNFSLSASPASLSVARASNGSSIIAVNKLNGFAGNVSLALAGLPAGVTAAFSPASATTSSSLMFTASSSAVLGSSTVTVTGTSGTLKASTTILLTVTAAPSFTLTFAPASLNLTRGFSTGGTLTIVSLNGFNSPVTLSASGLPTGVTASFGAVSANGTVPVTFAASGLATVGTASVRLTGISGALNASAAVSLTVVAPAAGMTPVNLSPAYNVNALVMDGQPFTGAGLDGGLNGSATAYSANLVGAQQTIAGTPFSFGPANALDSVSAKTITLPSGAFSSLKLLATGLNGAQTAQGFKVTYTDGSSTTFTQSLSDWFTPQGFGGESKAMTMSYRDNGAGQRDNRTFYLYEYAFTLNPAKTVASITLPSNRSVVVLAATLAGATPAIR